MLALEILNLCKTYNQNINALSNLSFNVPEGSFFALLGPNGAGKSTTIGIISSSVKKTSGTVKIFENDIDTQLEEAKACIGLVPQEFNFFIFETLLNILVNQAGFFGVSRIIALERAEFYLKLLGLWHKKDTPAGQLSGGMKRRLMIARAMMHQPKILILDEPTAGLDIETRHQIWVFLTKLNKEHNITIILTTHYLEEAEHLCNTIAIMSDGKIIKQDSKENILNFHSKQKYLAKLSKEMKNIPKIDGINLNLKASNQLEIEFDDSITISAVIEKLSKLHIEISTLNFQGSRLEELYLTLTRKII
jgi:ABC-2 type transport system ATP-binding protein